MKALSKCVVLDPWTGAQAPMPQTRAWPAPAKSYNDRNTALHPYIDTFVIHATSGSNSSGAMSVAQAGTASWHWLIPDENEEAHGKYLWSCVLEEKKAWHVLKKLAAPWDGKIDTNSRSLGVEIVNAQTDKDPFSDWQVKVLADLVNYARSRYSRLRYLVTHAYLDPGRKLDPGSLFPWDKFLWLLHEGAVAAQKRDVYLPTWLPFKPLLLDRATGKTYELQVAKGGLGDHRADTGRVYFEIREG